MHKLIVEFENGNQELIQVGEGGAVNTGLVLWDTRKDGALNQALLESINGLVRSGSSLVVDQNKLTAYQQAEALKAADKEAKRAAKEARRAVLAQINDITNVAGCKQALKTIAKELFDID